ncbi:hypothetical protein [Streptomyces sp. NPDC057877]|uniref:hypothetical protein n=1 Tax=Streptomyces sp. NPDC057877 TaxID=3346269 RepID=UPI0036B5C8C3
MDRSSTPAPDDVSPVETVRKALADWERQTHRELKAVTPIDAGGSGGVLVSAYVRELDPGQRGGRMIIKMLAPSDETVGEPGRHKAALLARTERNAAFVDRHLVPLALEPQQVDGTWVMFQRPAGDEDAVTLAAVDRRRLPHLAERIVTGVLEGWNPEDPKVVERTAAEFVRDILDKRLARGAALHRWVVGHLRPQPLDTPWFLLPGGDRPVPNPHNLGPGSDLARHHVDVPQRGRAHGDLHPGNIMVPRQPGASGDDFVLIDLSRFSDDALLARDPAQLLLCLVAGYLPHMDDDARDELIPGLLHDPCDGTLIPQGLAALVATVRTAWTGWGERHRIQRDWRRQWYLAVQACALMFLGRKGCSDRDRWWFYRLAAEACGAYLDEEGVRRPGSAPELTCHALAEPLDEPGPAVPVGAVVGPPPARDDDAVLRKLLMEIWDTFEHRLQELTAVPLEQIPMEMATAIRLRAVRFRTDLRRELMASADAQGSVGAVLAPLRTLAECAESMETAMARGDAFRGRKLLRDLVDALEDLLDSVREARRRLP